MRINRTLNLRQSDGLGTVLIVKVRIILYLEASESGKMKDRMERAKLKSELHSIQRLVDRIPSEVPAELKRQTSTKER